MKRLCKIRGQFAAAILLVVFCSSCFENDRRAEKLMTRAITHFHNQLNNEQYHEIYLQADDELRKLISEPDFSSQLAATHGQLGSITSEPLVMIQDTTGRALRQAFGPKRDVIPHRELTDSETAKGSERFLWAVEDEQAKLVSYEFRFICHKPCNVAFDLGN